MSAGRKFKAVGYSRKLDKLETGDVSQGGTEANGGAGVD